MGLEEHKKKGYKLVYPAGMKAGDEKD